MGKRGPQKLPLTGILAEFAEHLKAQGYSATSVTVYTKTARQFINHIGHERIDRISEADTRAFFERYKRENHRNYGARINLFFQFAMKGLPLVVDGPKSELSMPPATKKQLALKAKWTLDKLITEKEKTDDLVALLGRKVIDFYLYCDNRIAGREPENLDTIARFADECKELVQGNLALFMQMSAAGRNVHSRIDERVQT